MGEGIVGLADRADDSCVRDGDSRGVHIRHGPASARVVPDDSVRLVEQFFPVIWIAIAFQFVSGFTLWMSKPAQYLVAGMFDVKFTLVIVGVVLTAYFQGTIKR